MPYKFQYATLDNVADYLLSRENFELHLIKSDFTLQAKHVKADLDAIRADYTGYAGKTLTGGVVEEVAGLDKPQIRYALQTFTGPSDASGQNIYGYYVFEASGGNIMTLVFKFNAPQVMTAATHSIQILPQWPVDTLPNS